MWLQAQRGRLNVPVLRAVWFSVLACVPGTSHQGQKTSEKKSGRWFPIRWVSTNPPIFPKPLMNLQAHPRGPPGELETAQLLCGPSASLVGPRGAARLAGLLNNGQDKDPFVPALLPQQSPRAGLFSYSPRGLLLSAG